MERKEPHATQEEFNRRIIRYHDIPAAEEIPSISIRRYICRKDDGPFCYHGTQYPGSRSPP